MCVCDQVDPIRPWRRSICCVRKEMGRGKSARASRARGSRSAVPRRAPRQGPRPVVLTVWQPARLAAPIAGHRSARHGPARHGTAPHCTGSLRTSRWPALPSNTRHPTSALLSVCQQTGVAAHAAPSTCRAPRILAELLKYHFGLTGYLAKRAHLNPCWIRGTVVESKIFFRQTKVENHLV